MANENLNIVIKAVDKTKQAFGAVTKSLQATKSASKSTHGALSKIEKSSFNALAKSMNSVKRGAVGMQKALVKAAKKSKGALKSLQSGLVGVKNSVFSLQGALIGLGAGAAIKSIITVASDVESLRIRLKFLTGSTEDASKAFKTMNQFASKVPFSLQDIERASPSLLTVADNVDELNSLLAITGDIAAVSGLSFDETAMQLQRAMSAGIASADLFRERGVNAFLGFQSGVSVSAEETKKRIKEMWRDGTTTAVGATKDLSKSFMGQVSMMEDAFRELKLVVADAGVFEEARKVIIDITDALKDPSFKEGVKTFSKSLISLFNFMVNNKDTLLLIGSALLGAKLGSSFGIIGASIGAALGVLVLFNKEIKELFGFTDADKLDGLNERVDSLNERIKSTIDLIAASKGNALGMVGDKSNVNIDEANEKLAELRLQLKAVNEQILEMKPIKPHDKGTVMPDLTVTAAAYKAPPPPPTMSSNFHQLTDIQNAHYEVLRVSKIKHDKLMREQQERAEQSGMGYLARHNAAVLEQTNIIQGIQNGQEDMAEGRALAHQNKMIEMTHQYLAKQSAIKKAAAANDIDTLQESGKKTVSALSGHYKWAFDLHKSFAIKDALIDTYKAVSTAMASAPPPLNYGLAAVALAQGVANVQTLRSTQFREKGGPVSSGSPYIVGERGRELFVPQQAGTIVPSDQLGGGGNYTINISANDTEGFDELLTKRRGTLMNLINQALNENGRPALA